MRFRKIEIPAYGPFTGFEENLLSENSDLHIFYGPNEAGKSSLLRSLRDFLFGIHPRSPDNFIHDYRDMRIAAELENKIGSVANFQRRKGNSATLLDAAGSPLPDAAISEFLGGVDAAYFDSMFGLDFDKLRAGAEELLRGEGRLGEALFSASLGGTPVDKVLKSLKEEAAALFKGRSQASIRTAKRQLDESQKAAREAITRPEVWEENENALSEIKGSRSAIETRLRELSIRRDWLIRCRDILPSVGRHADLLRLLSNLPKTPDLDENFPELIRDARRSYHTALEAIPPLENQILTLKEEAAALSPDKAALRAKPAIMDLTADSGTYREQKKNHTKAISETSSLYARICHQANELGLPPVLSKLEAHRVSKIDLLETRQTAEALAAARSGLSQVEVSTKSLTKEIIRLEAQRNPADPTAISALETTLAATKNAGEIAAALPARIEQTAALLSGAIALHQRLTSDPTDLSETAALRPPLKSSLGKFRDAFAENAHEQKSAIGDVTATNIEISSLKSEISFLAATGDIPSLTELTDARAHREKGWQAVLNAWKHAAQSADFSPGKPLETSYPDAVSAADDIADGLRNHAETVARIEEKKARINASTIRLTDAKNHLDQLTAKATEISVNWETLLQEARLPQLAPSEIIEWCEIWENFSRIYMQWQADSAKITEDSTHVKKIAAQLRSVLPESENSSQLESLLEIARTRIDNHNQAVGAEKSLTKQISTKKHDLLECESCLPELKIVLTSHEKTWSACRDKFSFPESLSPENVLDLLHSRSELFITLDRHNEIARDAISLAKTISEYEAKVAELISALGLKQTEAMADVSMLAGSLASAESDHATLENLESTIAGRESALMEARSATNRNRSSLNQFLTIAGDLVEEELDQFLKILSEKSRIQGDQRTLREAIAGAARGTEVEDFIDKVREENPDEIAATIAEIAGETQRLTEELETLNESIRGLDQQRRMMENASDAVAVHTQQAELAIGRIRADGERFVRLQLAISILKNRIEVFREQNQGPFMEKAGHWFSEITGGAFSGITPSFDSGDTPVITALRAKGGKSLAVSGMSEGTRDQLFLALRLAGLEIHGSDHEPMPLILDDLLVHFDDVRSANALRALAEFGKTSQVLLFTHHTHLMKLATETLGKTGFHPHNL